MIKNLGETINSRTIWDHECEIYCDSCHVKIAWCMNFQFKEGQELVYSPILCESCGQKHNKTVGEHIKHIQNMEKMLKELKKDLAMQGWSNLLITALQKHGLTLDYFKEEEIK